MCFSNEAHVSCGGCILESQSVCRLGLIHFKVVSGEGLRVLGLSQSLQGKRPGLQIHRTMVSHIHTHTHTHTYARGLYSFDAEGNLSALELLVSYGKRSAILVSNIYGLGKMHNHVHTEASVSLECALHEYLENRGLVIYVSYT